MTLNEKDYLTINEVSEYLSLGKTSARKFMKQIGAERKIGRLSRYDRKVITDYINTHNGIESGVNEHEKNSVTV